MTIGLTAYTYIGPPEPHVLTDEVSGDKDEGAFTSNLSTHQLQVQK